MIKQLKEYKLPKYRQKNTNNIVYEILKIQRIWAFEKPQINGVLKIDKKPTKKCRVRIYKKNGKT